MKKEVSPMNAQEAVSASLRVLRFQIGKSALLAFTACSSAMFGADILRLPNGEVLVGKVIERTSATVVFESQTVGRVVVPAAGAELVPSEGAVPAKPVARQASSGQAAPGAAGGEPAQSWVRKRFGLPTAFSGNVDVGIDLMNSDVKVRNYKVEANFSWKTEANEYATYHAYESMRVKGVQATKTHDEGIRWIRHLPPRWMLLSQVDWRSDENQGVDYRVDAVFVPSFYFWKAERFHLLGGVGLSHEWRRWMIGDTEIDSHFNYAAYQVMRLKLTQTLSLRETVLAYMDTEDSDNRRSVFDVTLRQRLSPGLSLILNFNNRHETNPAPRAVKRQERLITKLGYEF